MVLEIKPTAEDIETAVLSPSRHIGEPTCQLFDENFLAQFAEDVRNVLVISRGAAFLAAVQPAHLRNGDDRALTHDRPGLGSVPLQSQVRPRPVIVCQIIPQHLTKVSLI
jgi:hypothetical protein